MRNCIAAILILFLLANFTSLQAQPSRTLPDSIAKSCCESPWKVVVHTWKDGWQVAAAPPKWRSAEFLKAMAVAGVAGLLYATEVELNQFWQDHQNSFSSSSAKISRQFGNKFLVFPAFGSLYLAGYFGKHPDLCRLGNTGLRSLVIAGVITAGLKFLAQREGPGGFGHNDWHGPKIPFEGESFPSGHTTVAFVAATVLSEELQFSPALKFVSYSLATGTAWSRIYDQKHWATDVFAGAVIGYFTTKAVLKLQQQNTTQLSWLQPFFSGNAAGIACHF